MSISYVLNNVYYLEKKTISLLGRLWRRKLGNSKKEENVLDYFLKNLRKKSQYGKVVKTKKSKIARKNNDIKYINW